MFDIEPDNVDGNMRKDKPKRPRASPLRWEREPDRKRTVARCGSVLVGAVFWNLTSRNFVRWRIWITINANPVEGVARNAEDAMLAIEGRFDKFLERAGLTCINPEGESR